MNRARNISRCGRFVMAMTVALAPLSVRAAEKEAPPPSGADFARLQREVAEQRQLLIEMMRVEQQRYDMLLRLLQSGGQAPPSAALPPPITPPTGTTAAPAQPATGGTAVASSSSSSGGGKSAERLGTLTGRVEARNGALKDAYVYVDMAKGSSGRGHTLEIKQKDRSEER